MSAPFHVRFPGQQDSGDDIHASPKVAGPDRTAKEAVRASKVARAKELVRDPNYPSNEVLTAIGRHFARHWIS